MPPALSKPMPDGIRLFIAGRPFPYFPGVLRPESKREKKTPSLFTPSIPPPLRPYGMPYFKQPPDSDGDFRPDLKKVFSGMGRAREGKGQFLQKTPLPLSSPLLHGSHNTHPPKTTAAPKGRRDEGMTRGRPRPHRGHGRPACYSISSVRIMWRAAAVSSRRRTGIFTGASSSCWGSDLPRATISRRASM